MELVGEQLAAVTEPRQVGDGVHADTTHLFPLTLVTRVIHPEPMLGAHDRMVGVLGGYVQRSCEHGVRRTDYRTSSQLLGDFSCIQNATTVTITTGYGE